MAVNREEHFLIKVGLKINLIEKYAELIFLDNDFIKYEKE